jgi:hypothetical protein
MRKLILAILLIMFIINHVLLVGSQQTGHNSDLFSSYGPIYNFDVSTTDETGIVLQTSSENIIYDCYKKCNKMKNCVMLSYKLNQCKLYSQVRYSISITTSPCLFEKKIKDYSSINAYLTNHWPFNNNLNDIISRADLYGGSNYSFTTDRLNSKLSALYLNQGFLRAPTGVYFNGEFTISVWIKPSSAPNKGRIVDFGGGTGIENVILSFSSTNLNPYVCSCAPGCNNIVASKVLKIGKWYHLAYTMSGTTSILYVNGEIWTQSSSTSLPRSYTRTSNYIGRSNWAGDAQFISSYIDDLKIYNKSFTYSQIMKLFNSYF